MRIHHTLAGIVTIGIVLSGCSSSDESFSFPEPTRVDFDAAVFDANSATINNPYLNFAVGRKTVYEGSTEDGLERIEIEVLAETKTVNGVSCAIVLDRAFLEDTLVEETWDWFAQDTNGNVWYMGEDSNDYEDGVVVSTAGSWEAGKDVINIGFIAEAGIQMFADPTVGSVYYQEYYEGEAIDAAEVIDLASPITLYNGLQTTALKIKEWNPYEPDGFEYKYFVENVGLVLETDEDGEEPIALISEQD